MLFPRAAIRDLIRSVRSAELGYWLLRHRSDQASLSKMNQKSKNLLPIAIAAYASLIEPACADGLGGLQGAGTLYLIAAAVVSGGILMVAAYLIHGYRLRESKRAKKSKVLLAVSILYLLAAAPVFAWLLTSPQLHVVLYLIVTLYLAVLAATLLQFHRNRRHVFGFVGLIFLYVLLATPEIVSYTDYELIDNVPLEHTLQLADQKDDRFVHLADGRVFRIRDRIGLSSPKDPFATDAKLMLEKSQLSEDSGVFILYGIRVSPQYHGYRVTIIEPLIKVPMSKTTIEMHESYIIGMADLLDSDWKADDRTLARAIFRHCCDAEWVDELVRRDADPKNVTSGSRNVMHVISDMDIESTEIEKMATVFIKAGVNLNAKEQWGNTPLNIAIDNFGGKQIRNPRLADLHQSYLTLLLVSGADPNITADHGIPPLQHTIERQFYKLSRLLLEYGADPNMKDSKGTSAFDIASARYSRLEANTNDALDDEGRELKQLVLEMRKIMGL